MKQLLLIAFVSLTAWDSCRADEYQFIFVEMKPKVADSFLGALDRAGEKAIAKLGELAQAGTVTKLGEVKVEAESGERAQGGTQGAGLHVHMEASVNQDRTVVEANLSIGYTKEAGGKTAQTQLVLSRALVPGVPSVLFRSDRDGVARILLGKGTIEGAPVPGGALPAGSATCELKAQLFEFGTEAERNSFFLKNKGAADGVAKLKAAAKSNCLVQCAAGPGQRWKLEDFADVQKKGDDSVKDGMSISAEQDTGSADAAFGGKFSNQKPDGTLASCDFADVRPGRASMFKCDGSKPCILVVQTKVTGTASRAMPQNDDPFGN